MRRPSPGRDDQRDEHDVTLVALEVVGVAAADPAELHLLLANRSTSLRSMSSAWASASIEMTPNVLPS